MPGGSADVWRIGAYGSPAHGYYTGYLDDVRIYKGALTAAEVQRDMNGG